MRKLLLVVFALAALSMIAPNSGYAVTHFQNMIGLYIDQEDLTVHTKSEGVTSFETVHIIIQNPYFNYVENVVVEGTDPITLISGMEFLLTAPAGQFAFYTPPVESTNIGSGNAFVVGYSVPIAVTDGTAYLGFLTLGGIDTGAKSEYLMGPVSTLPTFPGKMAGSAKRSEFDTDNFVMYPVSGSHELPVLVFNPDADIVATENASWGEVKALYR